MINETRLGIFRIRRGLLTAVRSGVLIGGRELQDPMASQYIQYAPKYGHVTVEINGDAYPGVTLIEHGKPCGVVILHAPSEDFAWSDFFPEEITDFKILQLAMLI